MHINSQLKNGMVDWLEIVDKAGGEAAWVTQQKYFPKRNGRRQKSKDSNKIIEMILKTESMQVNFYG